MNKIANIVDGYILKERNRPRFVVVAKNEQGQQIVAWCGEKPAIFNDSPDAELHACKLREAGWNEGWTINVEPMVIL